MNPLNFVSIIVPVRNGEQDIGKVIEALLAQNYPKSETEIIIVDNGSQDRTKEFIKQYPVILEIEDQIINSYTARNKGIKIAKGDVFAFTDADCVPAKNWLSEGVRALNEKNADMAGGEIKFILSERLSASEIIDSMIFLQNRDYVKENRGAVTANLFVRSSLFGRLGLFAEVRSGGDIEWTSRALRSGFSLIYAPQAIVLHRLRKFKELMKKAWRVGAGIGIRETMDGKSKFDGKVSLILRLSIPLPHKNIRGLLINPENKDIKGRRITVFLISYFFQLTMLIGILSSIVRSPFKK